MGVVVVFYLVDAILAVIASKRGWGKAPYAMLFVLVILGVATWNNTDRSVVDLMVFITFAAPVIFVIMAIFARRPSGINSHTNETVNPISTVEHRVKCPYCAELILPEAKICRFCGKDLPRAQ